MYFLPEFCFLNPNFAIYRWMHHRLIWVHCYWKISVLNKFLNPSVCYFVNISRISNLKIAFRWFWTSLISFVRSIVTSFHRHSVINEFYVTNPLIFCKNIRSFVTVNGEYWNEKSCVRAVLSPILLGLGVFLSWGLIFSVVMVLRC